MGWREKVKPIIASVIADVGTSDMAKLRQALRDAFPFGPRQYHPYKIWLDEINVQLGLKKTTVRRKGRVAREPITGGQRELF